MTDVWGPPMWDWLHRTASLYPTKPSAHQQKQARQVLGNLGSLIPCGECRGHYEDYLKAYPITDTVTIDRESLSRWVEGLHNAVNVKLGRPGWTRLRTRLAQVGLRHLLIVLVCFLVSLALWQQGVLLR